MKATDILFDYVMPTATVCLLLSVPILWAIERKIDQRLVEQKKCDCAACEAVSSGKVAVVYACTNLSEALGCAREGSTVIIPPGMHVLESVPQ